jgi:hypothetical protein
MDLPDPDLEHCPQLIRTHIWTSEQVRHGQKIHITYNTKNIRIVYMCGHVRQEWFYNYPPTVSPTQLGMDPFFC